MLSETFAASFLTNNAPQTTSNLKDVGICIHEFQPASALRFALKKSSTERNCLAVSSSHVFAAQAGKAVVHVYSRERSNQEATVPFPERIRSLALAGGDNEAAGVLVLGTEGGRLILWEICTGRQISTSPSHLQAVTSLAIDPTSNFIISGSEDANIHVWSLPNLISFSKPTSTGADQLQPNGPLRTFSNHRSPITSVAVGHSHNSSNIAISVSKDNTAIVWEYRTGRLLRTFLLPASPLCLAVDPADRAFYVGYDDGSVQLVDFFKAPSLQNILHDTTQQSTPSQLSPNERWIPPSSEFGPSECLTLSYDGMSLLSGHRNGAVVCWDIAKGRYASTITTYNGPVTNLQMLVPSGLCQEIQGKAVAHNIVKPRYDHTLSNSSGDAIPASYSIQAHLSSSETWNDFTAALEHPFFPSSLISEGLSELATWGSTPQGSGAHVPNGQATQLATSSVEDTERLHSLESELELLKKQLSLQESARHATVAEMAKLKEHIANVEDYSNELHARQQKADQARLERQARKEERALKRREVWFEAEKRGQNGDAAVKKMEAEDTEEISDTEVTSSDDN